MWQVIKMALMQFHIFVLITETLISNFIFLKDFDFFTKPCIDIVH